ncbi:hypothetical protein [Natrialba asiatica]|uniref:DUF4386 family protein n=1 Tax=Natrialba asiatica (strain ATCC 700177 / DSM 12278 / JCM 9576 / FERM P-10747 / NBRC 102637 / 172P1) TaxID=29540 RepID=M0AQL9_NATA1|nr:hypothetical protein [Natrialba asiatica]ELZ00845.1 hypothetical protein C481_11440 [Natrialba asiatica DSM 12278]
MTGSKSTGSGTGVGLVTSLGIVGRYFVILGTPLVLAATFWFHPHAGDDIYTELAPVSDTWFYVHILLLPLFGLLGIGVHLLLAEYEGPLATVGRIGNAAYLICYTAFESIAGIATAVVLREAQHLPPEQQEGVAAVVQVLFNDPLNGVAGVLALLGIVGNLVAVVSLAVLLRRSGAPLVPLVLLAGLPIGITTHGSNPTDVLSILLFFLAIAWLELSWKPSEKQQIRRTT